MLSKKKQGKFLIKTRDKISLQLISFCENQEPENLHKMRVEIKKLRSFIYFLRKLKLLNHYQNAIEPVKNIFKHGGRIRMAQVNLELAKKLRLKTKNFREEQNKIIETELLEFCLIQKSSVKSIKSLFKYILPFLRNIRDKRILDFFKKEIKKSRLKLQTDMNPEEWHSFRKQLKIILHIYHLQEEITAKKISLNSFYLDDLQESIGKWHDKIEAFGLINQKTRSGKLHAKKIIHESDLQKQEITVKANNFIVKSRQLN